MFQLLASDGSYESTCIEKQWLDFVWNIIYISSVDEGDDPLSARSFDSEKHGRKITKVRCPDCIQPISRNKSQSQCVLRFLPLVVTGKTFTSFRSAVG